MLNKRMDKILISLAVFYIVFPVVIFLFGWIKLPIAILVSALMVFLSWRLIKGIQDDAEISITKNKKFWLIGFAIIAVWALFSGIGNFSYQTGDFCVRNPMFRDLQIYHWPVIYDLSMEPEIAKPFLGESNIALYVYYFSWWLPAALLAQVLYFFGFSVHRVEILANMALYVWAVLGLFLTFYCLVRYLKKYSYWILSAFILFGGFDFIVYYLINMKLPVNTHIEWWAGGPCNYFQYSANTTLLYWVFNQSIPVWLIVAMLLILKDNKVKAGWASLCFAYSPYATIGMVPITIASILLNDGKKMKERIMKAISIENICVPISMLAIYGLFYFLVLSAGTSDGGFLFKTNREFRTFTLYITFIIVEFLIYFAVMGKTATHYNFYWVTLIELLVFPLFKSGMNNDFTMRASIPALFLLMVLCLQYLFEAKTIGNINGYKVMVVCLLIGYLVSATEIQRNISETMTKAQSEYLNEGVYSFGCMQTDNSNQINVIVRQYMALEEDLNDSLFYNVLLK